MGEPASSANVAERIQRLLDDDGVTLRASDEPVTHGDDDAPLGASVGWQLDPQPLIIDGRQWAELEPGLIQRADLLQAVFADLYGPRRLLAEGVIPPEVIWANPEYIRAAVGLPSERLFLSASDIGRDEHGAWHVVADHARTPVGAGYALENRRVLSRANPDAYANANLLRLTPFFQSMRMGLTELATARVEDPQIVVLTAGTHAATGFDQAFLAAHLGLSLLEGSDLVVRDGRVWLRSAEVSEPVDVIFRHVPSQAIDPLELQAGSKLGVAGLTETVRRRTVMVLNPIGAAVVESPTVAPFLPAAAELLLGEPLRLPQTPSWWCGTKQGHDFLVAHASDPSVVVGHHDGARTVPAELTAAQRGVFLSTVAAAPTQYAVTRQIALSATGVRQDDGSTLPERVVVRCFQIDHAGRREVMPGGLGIVVRGADPTVLDGQPTKDVWVVDPVAPVVKPGVERYVSPVVAHRAHAVMVPRVLDDLHWMGRYVERAEDVLRLILATHDVVVDAHLEHPVWTSGRVLLDTCHTLASPPKDPASSAEADLRDLIADLTRRGSVARSVTRLARAADGVRDQLSADVWVVLAGIDRDLRDLRRGRNQLVDAGERVLAGLLALTGIMAENMVRDAGWYLLDVGRGLERAAQVSGLLRTALAPTASVELVTEATLRAAESVVTYRRRHGGRMSVGGVLELLVADVSNPRSVAHQAQRMEAHLMQIPDSTAASRPLRLFADVAQYCTPGNLPGASNTADYLDELRAMLRALGGAIREHYLSGPPTPQPLWVVG